MKWIVKNSDGVLEFKSIKVCTESQFNKIMAGVNQQRILNWCDDHHVMIETQKGQQHMTIIREIVTEINESEARRVDILHDNFLSFIDTLPEAECENEEAQPIDTDIAEIVKMAKQVVKKIDAEEIDGAALYVEVGPINIPNGIFIPAPILKELFNVYIEKYG